MKNMKMKTKLILGFLIPIVLMLVNIILGDTTTKVAARISDPVAQERYIVNSAIFTAAIAVVAGVVTVILALMLIKTIEKSVKQLSDAAKEIALGHVDIELVKYNNDEFGNLVDEYIKVIDNIKYQARIAEEVSNGNLTMTVKPKSAEDLLGNSLKKLVEDNHSALSNISDAAQQVTVGSSQVASASQSLAQGTTEQASAIQQITSSIDEISAKTKQNAAQANEAADLVGDAIEDVKRGNAQMKDMMTAMQEINKSSEDVRSLAAKSAAAAAETAELIEDSIEKVGVGSKLADDTAKALEVITGVVQQSEGIINGIAESSNYQATAIAQIEQAISQVSQVVQTNSATSEECAAASEELSNQASRMKELLSIYNLGANAGIKASGASGVSASKAAMNEQIISLGDGFGKY